MNTTHYVPVLACVYTNYCFVQKLSQILQTYGRCPVCILSWVVRCDWLVNALKHTLHWNEMGMFT